MLTPDGSPLTNGRSAGRAPAIPGVTGEPDRAVMPRRPVPKTQSYEVRAPEEPVPASQQPAPLNGDAAPQNLSTQRDSVVFLESTKDALIVRAAKRSVSLLSDAIVLTLAAPFLAIWWLARAVRRRLG
jgi:hypothetical protein